MDLCFFFVEEVVVGLNGERERSAVDLGCIQLL